MSSHPKEISKYLVAEFSELREGEALPFSVFLYFPLNQHILRWIPKGETPSSDFIRRYRERGVRQIWVLLSEKPEYEKYKNPPPAEVKPAVVLSKAEAKAEARTEEGAFIANVMASEELSDSQKEEIVSEAATEIVQESASAETQEEQILNDKKARDVVRDVLGQSRSETQKIVEEIWQLSETDPELEHGVNVSTYAVIFAMAFGRIDPEVLSDLALAGLLHDVGLTQLSSRVTTTPWKSHVSAEIGEYRTHVERGMRLLEVLMPTLSPRVVEMVHQHHEKFDGSGYPRKLEGFQFDDIAQLVAMADLMDSVACGQWDGTRRTMKESFEVLEEFEKVKTFPEYYNPEVFARVIAWVKSKDAFQAARNAEGVVDSHVDKMVDG